MPDYASILRRSISALPESSPDMREAVYQRARAALARQLTAVDPPLSSREIEAQHQELEDAVVRLESEYAPDETPQPEYEPPKQEPVFVEAPPAPSQPRHAPAPPPRQAADDSGADFEPDDEEEDDFDEEDRASRIPALVGLLVVVLVVVGIGGYAYSQRDAVLGLIGLGPEEPMQAAPARVVSQDDGTGGVDKQDDRITNGSESPPPAAPPPDTSTATELPPSTEAQQPPETATNFGAATETDVASLTPDEPDTGLVGQRAIYYYQGGDGQAGEASEGTATWTNITKDGNPAIRATLSIPERDVDAVVTIYKNYDSSLPASHLVEIEFNGELADSPIQRVPALVLKQTEQARGQPLAGAAVPVTNELFWIALSDDQDQVARNIQLLREGSWFDVPILFNDQTRALLTFEKGIPGDKVFETVMATWTP
jgi:hypothetical protein